MYIVIALAALAVSGVLTMLLIPVVRSAALRYGLVDQPGGRRIHRHPTPLGGGVAMLLAILLPVLLAAAFARIWAAGQTPAWVPEAVRPHIPGAAAQAGRAMIILAGAVALCLAGLIDDRRHLGPYVKLAVQTVVAGAAVMLADLRILTVLPEPGCTLLSVLWILVIVNAMNFLDNMDGLAAGVALLCACALLALAAGIGQLFVSAWLCLLIGATAGFLVFNFPPARVFMGDAGSQMLGYLLAALVMLTTYYDPARPGSRTYGTLAPLLLLAVPLYDFVTVLTLRIVAGRHPMVGDTRHFSHRLVRRGMSPRSAVLTIYLCTAVTGIAAVLLPHVPEWAAWLVAAQTLGVLGIIALLEAANGTP